MLIIFSELSLTGYEPSLAKELSTRADDQRFDVFQKISNTCKVSIGVGVPTDNGNHVSISMILFQPNKPPLVYSKKYLHPDEDEFFVPGANFPSLRINDTSIGIAICYELSIPEHFSAARESGAEIYIASVAKFAKGVENAVKTLSDIAIKHSIPVLMVNAVGIADNGICTGKLFSLEQQRTACRAIRKFYRRIDCLRHCIRRDHCKNDLKHRSNSNK